MSAALGRSGRTLFSPLHVLGLSLLACLPREDLASYSLGNGVGGRSSGPSTDGSSGSGGDGGVLPTGGQNGGGEGQLPPELPLDPDDNTGSLAGADGSARADAGAPPPDAAVAADAGGALSDAGLPADECAESGGALVSDENVCLIYVGTARVSWQAASLGCQTRNAVLVSVKSLERDAFLTSLIDTDIWLGGFDPSNNPAANAFVWRDQTPVSTELEVWAAGEPDAVADQFCVSKTAPASGGQWRDAPCSELKAYVCERAL